jgi:hypothetical protein
MAVSELNEERVNVFPFANEYTPIQDIPKATVATIWENPKNGELWMLVFHEALYFGSKLKESLLCPNQMRDAGIKIKDVPMQFDTSSSLHSIRVNDVLEIPLEMHGVILHIRTQLPTDEELKNYRQGLLQSVKLTADPRGNRILISLQNKNMFQPECGTFLQLVLARSLLLCLRARRRRKNIWMRPRMKTKKFFVILDVPGIHIVRRDALLLQAAGHSRGMPSSWQKRQPWLRG